MKSMTRSICCLFTIYVLILPSFLLISGETYGDGMAFNLDTFDYTLETEQVAFIDHEDGIQRMTVAVDLSGADAGSSLWLFPVPAQPGDIDLAVETGLPYIEGENLNEEFEGAKDDARFMGYFVYFGSVMIFGRSLFWLTMSLADTTESMGGDGYGVTVHRELEDSGMHLELITSENGTEIYSYLSEKSLSVNGGSISQLDRYVEDGFTFIVSWITNVSELGTRPGIYMEFPTDEMFYPMELTSVYEGARIPITLVVTDHAEPELNREIKDGTSITYYDNSHMDRFSWYSGWEVESRFYQEVNPHFDHSFTLIEIDSKAENYVKDIRIKERTPDVIDRTRRASYLPIVLVLLMFVVGALVSTMLSLALFRDEKKTLITYSLMGLLNPLAIWIFLVVSLGMKFATKARFWKHVVYVAAFQMINGMVFIIIMEVSFHLV